MRGLIPSSSFHHKTPRHNVIVWALYKLNEIVEDVLGAFINIQFWKIFNLIKF